VGGSGIQVSAQNPVCAGLTASVSKAARETREGEILRPTAGKKDVKEESETGRVSSMDCALGLESLVKFNCMDSLTSNAMKAGQPNRNSQCLATGQYRFSRRKCQVAKVVFSL
jgi:hypothetical protein